MKIQFKGDLKDLSKGLELLAADLGVELAEGGYVIEAAQKPEPILQVSLSQKAGKILYHERCQFFRAFGLLVEELQAGKESFELTEEPQFNMNGPMFDVSQGNAAFNLPVLKKILRQLSLMGLNMMMLYCEDTYQVQNQPYFGYMRAKYTEVEMKELDDYAYDLGIEMIPCIQTLAHLPDPLRWKPFRSIKDYRECLLVGKDETYDFIRDLLISASRPFRTKKIHIGMDEAGNLGQGNYLKQFGYKPAHELMAEHLARVMEIINELGLEPMMWDDMFFRSAFDGAYYRPGATLPQEILDSVPEGMRCIFWNYYRLEEDFYRQVIPLHQTLSKAMLFAGGCWTWVGYSLAWSKTKSQTETALKVCKELGVKDIFMTTWGDNGSEALIHTNLIGCQLFAEHGYAKEIDYDKLARRFRFCTGGRVEDFELLELLDKTPQMEGIDDPSEYNSSKYLMWQDLMTGLCDYNIRGVELDAHYEALAGRLKEAIGRNGQFDGIFEFSYHVANVLAKKSQMGLRITDAYLSGDRATLEKIAQEELPDLRARYAALRRVHMQNWFKLYKHLGWDIMDMRYGALMSRIDSARTEIMMYLNGELERLEELEEPRLPYDGTEGPVKYLNYFGRIVSASRIAPRC